MQGAFLISNRVYALRNEMKARNIDIYIVPTSDFHESEYVGDYFKAREYLTDFTGSQGTVVVTETIAGLWTDGRYFTQAAQQIEGTCVTLYRMSEEGVPTIEEFIHKELKEGGILGFDGRVVNTEMAQKYGDIVKEKSGSLHISEDLVGIVWELRPPLSAEPAYILKEEYAGESTREKLGRVRKQMEEEGANIHILASLYDIAWLLNIRGNDISHVPVVLSYLLITKEDCIWFVNPKALNGEIRSYLEENQVSAKPYENIYGYLSVLDQMDSSVVLLDKATVNFSLYQCFKNAKVVDKSNPTEMMKAIKNPVELENTEKAHIKDGVAMTKFMYWMKTQVGKETITESAAAKYLEDCRRAQEGFLDTSFDTISAYGCNGAMMHYHALEGYDDEIKPVGLYLVDSGGHYLEGTTDITRTFAMGAVTAEEKKHFTAVCRGMLNLSAAKFLYGCNGLNLDILARGPIWDLELDYRSGTGHGVGHILNVHEGPNGIRWKIVPERSDSAVFKEGMITTNEPGIYLEGKYGIRTENELICRKGEKNEYGQFMYFETITFVPIDLDAIAPEDLSLAEKTRLNQYHKEVYRKVSSYLTEEERVWLKEYTREI